MVKLVPICTGNICRSAMANIVLRDAALSYGVPPIDVSDQLVLVSGGVSSEEQGNRMDRRAVRVLGEFGYDTSDPLISSHRAQRIPQSDVDSADMLLAMTSGHAQRLISGFGADPNKVFMWRWFELSPNERENHIVHGGLFDGMHSGPDLADPWYGGPDDFELALEQLQDSAEAILEYALCLD
jgi:protein-tyrosine phosphatase